MSMRTRTIQARASEDEYQALLAIARHQRRKPTEALRELVREKAKELGLWLEEATGVPPTWEMEET